MCTLFANLYVLLTWGPHMVYMGTPYIFDIYMIRYGWLGSRPLHQCVMCRISMLLHMNPAGHFINVSCVLYQCCKKFPYKQYSSNYFWYICTPPDKSKILEFAIKLKKILPSTCQSDHVFIRS